MCDTLRDNAHAAHRSNIVVALGDMAFRWTNLTEPWMAHIYALLRDTNTQVRDTLMLLAAGVAHTR